MTVTTTIEYLFAKYRKGEGNEQARLAQSVERQALNLVVGGSSPPVGDSFCLLLPHESQFPNMQPF